jgi:hypothetical protein
MDTETFVVAIEDLVDASEHVPECAPVVAEGYIYGAEAIIYGSAEANIFESAEAIIWGA